MAAKDAVRFGMSGGQHFADHGALADGIRLAFRLRMAVRLRMALHIRFGSHAGDAICRSPADISPDAHPSRLDTAAQPPVEAIHMAAARTVGADVTAAFRHRRPIR